MSDVGEDDALLYFPNPYDNTDTDIAGGSTERPPDFGSKCQSATGKQVGKPPLPPGARKRGKTGTTSVEKMEKEKGRSGDVSNALDTSVHVLKEKKRRKKMKTLFSDLLALLPQLASKADKFTIVDEALTYINNCQQTLQKLEERKLERLRGIALNMNQVHEQTLISPRTLSPHLNEDFMAQMGANNSAVGPSITNNALTAFDVPPSFKTFYSQNVVLNIAGDQGFITVGAPKRNGLLCTIFLTMAKHNLGLVSCQVRSDLDIMTAMMHVQTKLGPEEFLQGIAVEEVYKQAAEEIMSVVSSYCYDA